MKISIGWTGIAKISPSVWWIGPLGNILNYNCGSSSLIDLTWLSCCCLVDEPECVSVKCTKIIFIFIDCIHARVETYVSKCIFYFCLRIDCIYNLSAQFRNAAEQIVATVKIGHGQMQFISRISFNGWRSSIHAIKLGAKVYLVYGLFQFSISRMKIVSIWCALHVHAKHMLHAENIKSNWLLLVRWLVSIANG